MSRTVVITNSLFMYNINTDIFYPNEHLWVAFPLQRHIRVIKTTGGLATRC